MNKEWVDAKVKEYEKQYNEVYADSVKVIKILQTLENPFDFLTEKVNRFINEEEMNDLQSVRLFVESIFEYYMIIDEEYKLKDAFSNSKCNYYTQDEAESLIDTLETLRPYGMTIRENIESRYLDSEWKEYKGDIFITDPCYLIKDDDIRDYRPEKYLPSVIYRDTIYGDWSCTTFEKPVEAKKVLGEFCADGGEVCVVLKSDVEKYNSESIKDVDDKCYWCTTIHNFDGNVRFEVRETHFVNYEGEPDVDYNVIVVGEGNINFETRQTGF